MEYKGHLYGTTFEAVEQVQRAGKSCILHLQPPSIKKLRESKLKPFVILIKPPSFQRLQITRRDPSLQIRLSGVKEFKDEELHAMIRVSFSKVCWYRMRNFLMQCVLFYLEWNFAERGCLLLINLPWIKFYIFLSRYQTRLRNISPTW